MKSRIFMYLFIFSLLFILFQYMNEKKVFESNEKKISSLQNKLKLQDSLFQLQTANRTTLSDQSAGFVALQNDEYALAYIENLGYDALQIARTIEDQLIDQNKLDEDNPIVPYAGMEGFMRINKVRVLNHKWAIADFTDGTYWGQLLLLFDVKKESAIDFEVKESFLYPKEVY